MLNHIVSGQGEPVVFLHGWGGSVDSFKGIAGLLEKDCRCFLLDFYGFGRTPHPPQPLRLDDYAAAVESLLFAYKLENVTLVGHSFGGRVALKLAANPRVARLVIIDGAGIKPRRKPSYYFKVAAYKLKKRLKSDVSKCGSPDYRALPPVMKGTFNNVVKEDLKPLLSKIEKPAILIWGSADAETPLYMGKIMEKKLKNAALIVYPDAGHFSYLEQPLKTAAIIKAFAQGGVE